MLLSMWFKDLSDLSPQTNLQNILKVKKKGLQIFSLLTQII